MGNKQKLYVGYIHSVKEHFYNKDTKDKKAYFEKLTLKRKNKENLIIYKDILTNILYYSETEITDISFETKYITNLKKLKSNISKK